MSSSQFHQSQYCLICLNKCPLSRLRYSWSAMKEYYDGTMEHFRVTPTCFIFINNRRIYLKKRYYHLEFNHKVFGQKMQIIFLGELDTTVDIKNLN